MHLLRKTASNRISSTTPWTFESRPYIHSINTLGYKARRNLRPYLIILKNEIINYCLLHIVILYAIPVPQIKHKIIQYQDKLIISLMLILQNFFNFFQCKRKIVLNIFLLFKMHPLISLCNRQHYLLHVYCLYLLLLFGN